MTLPKFLYHGTSRPQIERMFAYHASGLYLADVEEKAWDYAEQQAMADDAELAMLVVEPGKLPGSFDVDVGTVEAEWDEDMGQWIYTGDIPDEAIAALYYIDEDTDERLDLRPKRPNRRDTKGLKRRLIR